MPINKNVLIETRIVVEIDESWIFEKDPQKRHQAINRHSEDIVSSIKRHVDDIRSAHVEHEYESQCEYCDAVWSEESETFNGGCCDKDMENEPND